MSDTPPLLRIAYTNELRRVNELLNVLRKTTEDLEHKEATK